MSPTIQSEKIQKNLFIIHILVSIISFPHPANSGLFCLPVFLSLHSRWEGLRSRRQRDKLPVFHQARVFFHMPFVCVCPFFPLSCEPEQIFYLLCISCRLLLRVTFMLYITILWRRGDVSSLAILQ